jgi:RES domain-containing protein
LILWRISNHAALNGEGGLYASARWHTQGRRIVYLAENPGVALLEVLVHLEVAGNLLPGSYQLLKASVADTVSRDRVDVSALPSNWEDDHAATRRVGDRWLFAASSALLGVPSAIVPETSNWLLNPAHADAPGVSIDWSRRFPYDGRLLRTGSPLA